MTDDEDDVDEALKETFPASDPAANTVENGVQVEPGPTRPSAFRDNREARRFELDVDGHVAFMEYERRPDAIVLKHTEVPGALRGRGVGNQLVKQAIDHARSEGLRLIVRCPFVRAYLEKHPQGGWEREA